MNLAPDYINSLCEVKSMSNHLIARGKITDIDADSLKITDKAGYMDIVRYNTEVKVSIFNSKIGFKVLVGRVLTSNESDIKITNLISLAESERRNFFRVDVSSPTKMYIANSFEEAKKTEPEIIIVNDISLSGMRIETGKELFENQLVWIELNIKNKTYYWECSIMRKVFYEEVGVYHYGCQFITDESGNSNSSDALCSYIFQKQREQINNKRDD